MKRIRSITSSLLAAAVLLMAASPALAGVTFTTRGQIKAGGLILNGVTLTATGSEINAAHDAIASVVQVATPATGSNTVQFTFHNAAGVTPTGLRSLLCYVSDVSGNQAAAVTSLAVATNGGVTQLVTGKTALVNTTSAGLLGVTLTASTGSYYLSFVLPNGQVITSSVLTVN